MIEDRDLEVHFHGQQWKIPVEGIPSARRFNVVVLYTRHIIQLINDEFSTKAEARMCCNREVDEEAWLRSGVVLFKDRMKR